ncbi:MAG TPA: phosphoenolpyruvate--protein phosphotransferase [Candidatus Hydrogenedens sp.]|nr:phosphoenolpyruvate--protein phosphotransferase [Candidatus Hydrogenedens sp.]
MEKVYHGIPVSPGIVWGEALVYDPGTINVPRFKIKNPRDEYKRVQSAIDITKKELTLLYQKTLENFGKKQAGIFDAHLMLLEDETILVELKRRIHEELLNAESVLYDIAQKYSKDIKSTGNSFIEERTADVIDVIDRIIRNLLEQKRPDLDNIKKPCILLSVDLPPSETARLHPEKIRAIVLERGSTTSHVAILARSMKIPTIVGVSNLFNSYTAVIKGAAVDAISGILYINPTSDTILKLRQKKIQLSRRFLQYEKRIISHPSQTEDGRRISVLANIELPNEVDDNVKHLSAGIGLYRTEYLFLNKTEPPTEEEQYKEYLYVAKTLNPLPVILRTIDIGGDKLASYTNFIKEQNPQLGCRAVRFCLAHKDFFKIQLRAMLRAAANGNIKIMFPMISSIEELRDVKKILQEVKDELTSEQIPFNKEPEIGIMIEIPAAVLIADELAKECNFFSIGTNDLIQYSLAVDRNNENIAHLYDPAHPSILRMLKMTVSSAIKANIACSICGEMASDPLFTELLIGLGLNSLSMSSVSIPQIRALITKITYTEATEFSEKILKCSSSKEVRSILKERINTKFKNIISIV